MQDLLCNKKDFLEYLNSNKFIRNIVDNEYFIEWDQPNQEFYYIEHKKVPTFLTATKVGHIYKDKYGTKPNAKTMDNLMQDMGFQIGRVDNKKIYLDCIERVD